MTASLPTPDGPEMTTSMAPEAPTIRRLRSGRTTPARGPGTLTRGSAGAARRTRTRAPPISRYVRPPVVADGHPRAMAGVAPDGGLDASDRRRDRTADEGEVPLLHAPALELGHQSGLGSVVPGDHQQTARVAVGAMHA